MFKRRLHIQFLLRFGILFWPNIVPLCNKKFGTKFGTNMLLHRETIFGPNKIPNCWTNWMCRRRFRGRNIEIKIHLRVSSSAYFCRQKLEKGKNFDYDISSPKCGLYETYYPWNYRFMNNKHICSTDCPISKLCNTLFPLKDNNIFPQFQQACWVLKINSSTRSCLLSRQALKIDILFRTDPGWRILGKLFHVTTPGHYSIKCTYTRMYYGFTWKNPVSLSSSSIRRTNQGKASSHYDRRPDSCLPNTWMTAVQTTLIFSPI